jgi:exopolysaccharide biosynthesis protein
VVVRGGVVRSNRRTLASGTLITGEMLVGRGRGARVLRGLRVGRRVRVQSGLSPAVRVAVSGSVQLLRGGQLTTGDNTQLHPRTAVGIDRDGRRLHLVVVDGRSELSRGQTLRQLAELLRSLGDEDAINLDGGGSSTLIARDAAGVVAVRNRPSDGRERAVPNGLAFRYAPPPG